MGKFEIYFLPPRVTPAAGQDLDSRLAATTSFFETKVVSSFIIV
jgi:hypothetical protein